MLDDEYADIILQQCILSEPYFMSARMGSIPYYCNDNVDFNY